MEITERISLESIPWQNVKRQDFLLALQDAILQLPLKGETKRLLSVTFAYDDFLGNRKKSLLFYMLDKGVIYQKDIVPSDWSNSLDIWMEDSFFSQNSITEEEVIAAFEDVNQYLEGFGFVLGIASHAWIFGYVSEAFQISTAEQMAKLFAMR